MTAADFNGGTDTYLQLATGSPSANSAYTWMADVYMDSDPSSIRGIFLQANWPQYGDGLRTFNHGDGKIYFLSADNYTGSGTILQDSMKLTIGGWTSVAVVRTSATSVTVHLDDASVTVTTSDVSSRSAPGAFVVGSTLPDPSAQTAIDGRIANMKVFDYALTAAEIAKVRATVQPSMPAVSATYDYATDLSGNGNVWTLTGTLGTATGMPRVRWRNPPTTQSVAAAAEATLVSILAAGSLTTISISETQQFTATGSYTDDSTADLTSTVTWSSSNPSVATISSTGLVTAISSGVTVLTATDSSTGIFDTVMLTVVLSVFNSDLTREGLSRRDAKPVSRVKRMMNRFLGPKPKVDTAVRNRVMGKATSSDAPRVKKGAAMRNRIMKGPPKRKR